MDSDGDVLCTDILPLSPTEILERQQFLRFQIIRNCLRVDDEGLDTLFDTLLVSLTTLQEEYSLLGPVPPSRDTLHSYSPNFD
jgi:hypothetical protein